MDAVRDAEGREYDLSRRMTRGQVMDRLHRCEHQQRQWKKRLATANRTLGRLPRGHRSRVWWAQEATKCQRKIDEWKQRAKYYQKRLEEAP